MKDCLRPHAPPSNPPGIDARTSLANADAEAKEPQPGTKSGVQRDPNLSQELWNAAYDSLEKEEDKLVEAYRNTRSSKTSRLRKLPTPLLLEPAMFQLSSKAQGRYFS